METRACLTSEVSIHLYVHVAQTIRRCFSACEAPLWALEMLDGLNTGQGGGKTCNRSLEATLQVLGLRCVHVGQDAPSGE